MKRKKAEKAPAKEQAENVNVHENEKRNRKGVDDFKSKVNLPGKTDSGPEPDVFGRDIPPQE